MKKRQEYKAKIRKGVAVGSALLLGASVGESAGSGVDASPSAADLAAIQKRPTHTPVDFSAVAGTSQSVNVSIAPELSVWKSSDARRFRELAAKRASGEASADEQTEFKSLQQRRRVHHLASPEEIISEWHRRRFVAEILDVLHRNVSFFKTEDQARLRSSGQT
jgi:hypothetical protein